MSVQKLIAFLLAFLFSSPAFGQDSQHIMMIMLKWPESAPPTLRVVILPEGGNCPEVMEGTSDESAAYAAQYGGLGWMQPGIFASQMMVSDYFTACTYVLHDGQMHYVLTSMVIDQQFVTPFTYSAVLPKSSESPPAEAPPPPYHFSVVLAVDFSLDTLTTGIMLRGTWYTPIPYLVVLGGLGAEFTEMRPVAEFGVGGGITTDIPGANLTVDGSLGLGGGVGSFQTHCGPQEYDSNTVYTCGRGDGFPIVFTGPWFGPMTNLTVLGPIIDRPKRKPLQLGGQVNVTVPLLLVGSSHEVTVHTTDGDHTVPYRWAKETTLAVFPLLGGGIVMKW